MPVVAMAPQHPYRAPGKAAEPPEPERPRLADLDAELVIFYISSVVLVAGALHCEFGVLQALAVLGLIFSGRQFVRAFARKDEHL